jgi:hypothetical protein
LRIAAWSTWCLLLIAVAMAFLFPKHLILVLGPVSFKIIFLLVILITAFYNIARLYKSGMTRGAR